MRNNYLPIFKLLTLSSATLFSIDVYASFNGTPCKDLWCFFIIWNFVLGIMYGGIPISILLFLGIHAWFCNRDRSRGKQAILGVINGAIAWAVASYAVAALAIWAQSMAGRHQYYPLIGFLLVYLPYTILSVFYVRSKPRQQSPRYVADDKG